ncbi:MAG: hypothetical protein RL678_1020 [Pseudomonadota bacterium]|jgi:hypothetical protein
MKTSWRRPSVVRTLLVMLLCCTGSAALAGLLSDSDAKATPKEENPLALPDAPKQENLLRYSVGAVSTMSFAIDAKSVSVGDDLIVRYSSVITSTSGAVNMSYEGIRCKTAERKLFATGRPDGSWNTVSDAEWRPVSGASATSYQATLMKDFFCDGELVAGKASAIVERIRRKKPLRQTF